MTTEKILDKLAKLKAAQEGEAKIGNSAAAEAFAGMINTMLLRYELSAVDIPTVGRAEEPIIEVYFDHDAHGVPRTSRRVGWQESLAGTVARAHMCQILVSQGSNKLTFLGTKSHATVAEYAFGVLARSADQMSVEARDEYWRAHSKEPDFTSGNFRAAWLQGFISRIGERFYESRKAEAAATGNTSTALVRLDNALARVNDYVSDKYKRSARATARPRGCYQGQQAGRAAADSMTLDRRGVSTTTTRGLRA